MNGMNNLIGISLNGNFNRFEGWNKNLITVIGMANGPGRINRWLIRSYLKKYYDFI